MKNMELRENSSTISSNVEDNNDADEDDNEAVEDARNETVMKTPP